MESVPSAGSGPIRLIVGLGNPGPEFDGTRHNLGFAFVEMLATRAGADWQTDQKWPARRARLGAVHLLQPLTFMNLSGEAVAPFAAYHRIEAREILVVLDDLALPCGKLRLRPRGSDGGHNGLASILQHLGTNAVPRLRIGIGSPPFDPVGFVLGRPEPAEQATLTQALQRALEIVDRVQDKGLDAAMNFANADGLT
jgi:PTH1 family peptidyl-tRNA hydrolase